MTAEDTSENVAPHGSCVTGSWSSVSMEEIVQAVHYKLPMSFDFTGDDFYVRDCYHFYYEQILKH